jgi:ATP-dependent RNA helicase DHX57
MVMSPGRTFPVEQLFLEDILDKTKYVTEKNSRNSRPGDMAPLECEFEMADIQGSTAVIQNPAIPDEDLTISQLYYRYKGKFCSVMRFVQKPV